MAFIVKKSVLAAKPVEHGEEWREYQPGVKLLIRGLGHRIVRVGLEIHQGRNQSVLARYDAGDISALNDAAPQQEQSVRMLAELVIADWEGFQDEDGEELPYSVDTAKAVLSSEEGSPLLVWAVAQAGEITKSATEQLDAVKGKSLPATSGKGSGQAKKAEPKSNA